MAQAAVKGGTSQDCQYYQLEYLADGWVERNGPYGGFKIGVPSDVCVWAVSREGRRGWWAGSQV